MKLMRGDMGTNISTILFALPGLDLFFYAGGAATVMSSALAIAQLKIP
jgi:hypothetical protein